MKPPPPPPLGRRTPRDKLRPLLTTCNNKTPAQCCVDHAPTRLRYYPVEHTDTVPPASSIISSRPLWSRESNFMTSWLRWKAPRQRALYYAWEIVIISYTSIKKIVEEVCYANFDRLQSVALLLTVDYAVGCLILCWSIIFTGVHDFGSCVEELASDGC